MARMVALVATVKGPVYSMEPNQGSVPSSVYQITASAPNALDMVTRTVVFVRRIVPPPTSAPSMRTTGLSRRRTTLAAVFVAYWLVTAME